MSLASFLFCQRVVFCSASLIAGVLEILHECQTQRVHKGSKARHREIQHVTENEDDDAEHPVHSRNRNVENHRSHYVERISEHTAGKAEGIESDVAQNVAQQSGHHIVCVPKTGADVQKRIASRCVENIDCKAADDCESDDCPFEGFSRENFSHPE